MIEVVAYILVGLGLIAGAFVFARRPEFWIEFGWRLLAIIAPFLWAFVSKRMDTKTEAEWRKCMLRGGKWDHRRKRCDR